MLPLSLAIVCNAFPAEEQARALGIWAAVSALALAIGPLAGGALIEVDWRVIFWINLPVAALGIAITAVAAPESTDPGAGTRIDFAGPGRAQVGLTAVVLALVQSEAWGARRDRRPRRGRARSPCSPSGAIEHRVGEPIVDFALFRNGPYFGASAAAFALVGAYWAVMFFQPQYLQDVRGHSADRSAGLLILPITAPMVFISPFSGRLIGRFGARRPDDRRDGSAASLGLLVLTQIDADSSYGLLLAGYLLFGIALGLVYAPMSTAAMAAMPGEKVGIASGVLAMDRVLAGAVALAATGAVFHALLGDGDSFAAAVAGSTWVAVALCAVGAVPHLGLRPRRRAPGRTPPWPAIRLRAARTIAITAASTSESRPIGLVTIVDNASRPVHSDIAQTAFQSAFCHPSRRCLHCPGMSFTSFGTSGSPATEGPRRRRPRRRPARGDRQHRPLAHRRPDRRRRPRRHLPPALRRDQARHRLHAGDALPGGEDGRRDRPQRRGDEDRLGQRPADAGPDDPLLGDRHPPPHRRARLQTDRRAGDRDLPAPRRRLPLRRGDQVHPPGHPRRARQGQPGPGDAREVPRSGSTRSPTRLTVLEFEGGGVLYDALAVLQRAELVTRMAVEVERYIVELGTEGRLIEMQLEETMVGVAADKTALIRDYSVEDSEQNLDRGAAVAGAACPTRTCSTSVASPSCSATTASSTPSTSRSRPRGYRVLGRIPRIPKLVVQKIIQELGGLEEVLAASDADLAAVDGVGPTRAKDIREGLRRLQEVDLVDRYLQS